MRRHAVRAGSGTGSGREAGADAGKAGRDERDERDERAVPLAPAVRQAIRFFASGGLAAK